MKLRTDTNLGRYGDSGRDSTAKKQYEAHEADGFKYDAKANHDFITSFTKGMKTMPFVDTSDRVDNKEVSEDTNELIRNAVSEMRKIYPPEVKLCEVCEVNEATAVIRPTLSSFDESRKTVPTTCKNCATKDDTNDYVLDLAKCGHAQPRFKNYIDCQECVVGRQRNNMLTREEKCRVCNDPLTLDNTYSNTTQGMICRKCTTENANERLEKNSCDIICDDCGVIYKKRIQKTKSIRTCSICVNHLQQVNAMCKDICQNTMEIGGITMRCRKKRYTSHRGNKDMVTSKFCGSRKKCLNRSQNKECWFVCHKTPENLTTCEDVSSENYEGDQKMAAV